MFVFSLLFLLKRGMEFGMHLKSPPYAHKWEFFLVILMLVEMKIACISTFTHLRLIKILQLVKFKFKFDEFQLKTARDQLLPVMFFIHGGGFFCGTGNPDLYGPDILLDKDIVLVTFNYRIGKLHIFHLYLIFITPFTKLSRCLRIFKHRRCSGTG